MHVVFIKDGKLKQGSSIKGIPAGTEYWHVNAAEKAFMDANREYRQAWTWSPARPADGVGQ